MLATKYGLTEDDLRREIIGLSERLTKAANQTDTGSKCARSYLKQALKDKRRQLATLRYQHGDDGPMQSFSRNCIQSAPR